MNKRLLGALALTPMVLAATAGAASGPTATATVTPNKAGAASGFSVSISGASGVPSQLAFIAQNGFTSDGTKAVSALCTSAQAKSNTCPSGSVIGSGSAGTNALGTLSFTLAAGAKSQPSDIASVYLITNLKGANLALTGRLFVPPGGGLELLLTGFPAFPGLSLTSVQLQAKGTHTVTTYTKKKVTTGKGSNKKTKTVKVAHKTTYSLLKNPSTCPSSGSWTGSVEATYSGQQTTLPFTAACTS